MDKKGILIFVFLLCGCTDSYREKSCVLNNGNIHIDITIHAKYDNILSLDVKESFIMPYRYVLDEEIRKDIDTQLDDTYIFIDNSLIREYEIIPEDAYSLSKTIEYLGNSNYVCR